MVLSDQTNITVMVVDDSMTIRRTAENLLRREGFVLITAENGFEALSLIVANRPDIVFLDIMMPRLNGYQTCAMLKANPLFRAIPVVMLSSKDGIFDKARGRLAGSEQFLTKPFAKDELLASIRRNMPTSAASAPID